MQVYHVKRWGIHITITCPQAIWSQFVTGEFIFFPFLISTSEIGILLKCIKDETVQAIREHFGDTFCTWDGGDRLHELPGRLLQQTL